MALERLGDVLGEDPQDWAQRMRELAREWRSDSPDSTSQVVYSCETCRGTGWLFDGDGYAYPCVCREREKALKRLREAGVADAFEDCQFDRFEPWNPSAARALTITRDYVSKYAQIERSRGNSLALLGAVGSGKTMLAAAAMMALLDAGVVVRYAPYREMVGELKGTVNDPDKHAAVFRRYAGPQVVFIDDLFKGATDADAKYVYDVINARYTARKPLIVTGELGAAALCGVDEAIGSRIVEMCRDHLHEFRGAKLNYRLRGLV